MTPSVVVINNKDYIPPNLCLTCLYIIYYSCIYKVLDLFIVGDLVLLCLANTQIIGHRFLDKSSYWFTTQMDVIHNR